MYDDGGGREPKLTVWIRVVVDVERIVDENLIEGLYERLFPLFAAQVLEHLVEHSSHLLQIQPFNPTIDQVDQRNQTSYYHHELVNAPFVDSIPFSQNRLKVRSNKESHLVILVAETADQIADAVSELFL